MKRNILLILSVATLWACSTKKQAEKTRTNATTSSFLAHYNTLFNGKDALETEIATRKKEHKDNFYVPYINILSFENQEVEGNDKIASNFFGGGNASKEVNTPLQIAEAKALKTIAKYSVMKNGEEKNKTIFDASIILARARLYQNKPLEALDALNYIFTNMPKDKRIDMAKVYQAQAFAKMGDYYRAEEIFNSLENSKKKYRRSKSIYFAEMLLASGKKQEAVEELEEAFSLNKNRALRSRIAFLRGQILASLGNNQEARESFATAYKYTSDFEFEVKSQIEIAKTFGKDDDYNEAKSYIEKIAKKGTYTSRKNEFLYALGLIAQRSGKNDEAQEFFRKALKERQSDPQLRGRTYYEIAQNFFNKNDYISAGAYYDSAISVMNYQPEKERLEKLSTNIKSITQNYYLVKKNDSILALTKMSEPERTAFFSKVINQLREKEAKEELLAKENEKNKQNAENGDYNANSIFANKNTGFQDFSGGTKGFYFANQSTIAKGQSQFRQVWGSRSLQDNWRFSARSITIEDTKNATMGTANAKDPRRFETEFYTEKIPTDPTEIAQLKKDRDTASLGLGRMYHNLLSNNELATKTLYDLVDNQPEEEVKLQALYEIFTMNFENNPKASERAKNLILSDFPYTPYAEFVKNPKSRVMVKSSAEVENLYKQAFELYLQEKYEDSKVLIDNALSKYPQDALAPKFSLLNAFNTGKTAGKEIMILQLEQIALNYEKTPEGEKAKEILKFVKSDLAEVPTEKSVNQVGVPNKSENKNPIPVETNHPRRIEKETQQKEESDSGEGGFEE